MKISFIDLLTILFIGLKLSNIIDWSWWWVLAPTWIPVAIYLAIWIFAGILSGIVILANMFKK